MARPNKQGVDYFPLDVHLDDKFKFIEIKFKLEGFATIIKLVQKIYSYGYWYKWTDDEALLFADEIRADFSLVDGVVKEAIDRGIFSREKYEKYNILTSIGIQKRYKEIVRRRKDVEVIDEYLLTDNNFGINDNINLTKGSHDVGNDSTECSRGDVKSTQSKVKESKVNKSNDNKIKFADTVFLTQEEYDRLVSDYGKRLVNVYIESLDEWQTNNPKKQKKDHNKTIRVWMKDEKKIQNDSKQDEEMFMF
jgi:hypothetical protein